MPENMGFGTPQTASPSFLEKLQLGLLGKPNNYGGMLSDDDLKAARQQALMAMGAQLLAAGGPSQQPVGLGQALGSAVMTGQQTQQKASQGSLEAMLLKSQIEKAQQKEKGRLVPVLDPVTGKPTFKYEGDAEGMQPYERALQSNTPASMQEFEYFEKLSPDQKKQFLSLQRSPVVPKIVMIDGVPTLVDPTSTTPPNPLSTPGAEDEAARRREAAKAEGSAQGDAAGAQGSKAPVAASMDYVLKKFEDQFDKTMQGGPLGIAGKAGTVFDYGDAVRFDNLREQLSTELRTVYRIPGEGTLSDREQAQYGIQLPNRNFPPSVNKAIVADLRERTRLRLETPVGGDAASGSKPKRVRVDAEGNVIGN